MPKSKDPTSYTLLFVLQTNESLSKETSSQLVTKTHQSIIHNTKKTQDSKTQLNSLQFYGVFFESQTWLESWAIIFLKRKQSTQKQNCCEKWERRWEESCQNPAPLPQFLLP
jgi:hypothetical protein